MQAKRKQKVVSIQRLIGMIASGLLTTIAHPASAKEAFDNTSVQFDVDTIVEFEFLESYGASQSTFGVINLATGEKTPLLAETKPFDNPTSTPRASTLDDRKGLVGTPGNTVPQPFAEFRFKAGTDYAFYLESFSSGKPAEIVYSANLKNFASRQVVKFEGGIANLANQGTTIAWETAGSGSAATTPGSFDDFIVRAGGHLGCPYKLNQ